MCFNWSGRPTARFARYGVQKFKEYFEGIAQKTGHSWHTPTSKVSLYPLQFTIGTHSHLQTLPPPPPPPKKKKCWTSAQSSYVTRPQIPRHFDWDHKTTPNHDLQNTHSFSNKVTKHQKMGYRNVPPRGVKPRSLFYRCVIKLVRLLAN